MCFISWCQATVLKIIKHRSDGCCSSKVTFMFSSVYPACSLFNSTN